MYGVLHIGHTRENANTVRANVHARWTTDVSFRCSLRIVSDTQNGLPVAWYSKYPGFSMIIAEV